jgi:hypothetical protein
MPNRSSKPRDANQAAKSILDQITGDAPKEEPPPVKNAAAVALGKLGGMKGGAARAAKLTAEQRTEIARKAAAGRWKPKTQASVRDETAKKKPTKKIVLTPRDPT